MSNQQSNDADVNKQQKAPQIEVEVEGLDESSKVRVREALKKVLEDEIAGQSGIDPQTIFVKGGIGWSK